ncbi:MAG: 4-hydroxythreonine-4-phosphate dehydrogenase PdxA [Flavobacteriaceae bacterium]|nr:4-hydroxythreonine-4-phosphate dehydrogenase PdxA [Flavobacteriaceae bacterium]
MNTKIKIGITIGDINGVGIEVILKTFEDKRMFEFFTPIVFGSVKVLSYYKKALNLNSPINSVQDINKIQHDKLNVVNLWHEDVRIEVGQSTEISGKYAYLSLKHTTESLKQGDIDCMVTAPINKDNIQSAEFKFPGHTEYLAKEFNSDVLMFLVSSGLRVGVVTGHVPLSEVSSLITPELLSHKIDIMYESLIKDFGIRKPKIALLGLNPHAGDNGVIGSQDMEIITPVVEEYRGDNKLVFGPYSADGFFGSDTYKEFDGVLAMYHDQGLIPFKTLSFGEGVNYTAGLSVVRTSPDHGTAYGIAGKNQANSNSFKEAVFLAASISKHRNSYKELTKNSI